MNGSRAVWDTVSISLTLAPRRSNANRQHLEGMMGDPLKDLVNACVSIWLDDLFMHATGEGVFTLTVSRYGCVRLEALMARRRLIPPHTPLDLRTRKKL